MEKIVWRAKKLTEKEKMLAGEWYNANFDTKLIVERALVKDLCLELNKLPLKNLRGRVEMLKKILPRVDTDAVEILSPFMVDYGYNISIGAGSFLNHNCYLMDCAEISLGKKVFVGPNCNFYTAIHPFDKIRRAEGLEMARSIEIGDDVWIGGDVTVLPGVKIGNGAVIGAKSLVTSEIPENSLAYGNPCRVIRKIGLETLLV